MADSRDPIKTPVVHIFNSNGEEIINSLGINGLSVVELKYNFDDEDDDECSIKLRASSSSVLDGTTIKYGSRLIVQWGYIGGPLSAKAVVVVRDIQTKYGNNVIWVMLQCTDYVTYLKTSRGDDAEEFSILEYIEHKCSSERGFSYKVVIKQFGEVVYKHGKDKKEELSENFGTTRLAFHFNFDPYKDGFKLRLKTVPVKRGKEGEEFSEIPKDGEMYDGIKSELEQFLLKKRNFTDGNRSPYQVLQDLFRYAPFGPWFVSGRGDTILIHNRNVFEEPFLYLNYQSEPGNLIDLTITSKYESFEQRTVSSPHLNPEDKIAYYEDVYLKELESTRDIEKIIFNRVLTDQQRKQELKKFLAIFRASKTHKIERQLMYYGTEGGLRKGNIDTHDPNDLTGVNFTPTYFDREGTVIYGGAKDDVRMQQGVMKDYGAEGIIFDPNYTPEWQNVTPFFVYLLPGATENETRDMMDNISRALEMDKVEARMIIEGDPRIISEAVVRLGNIQRIHKGDYYLKKVEHTVTENGFKVTMEAFKVMTKPSMSGITSKVEKGLTPDAPDVIKQYHREQALFKNWGLLVKVGTKRSVGIGVTGGSAYNSKEYPIYEDLNEYILSREDIPIDELVKDLLEKQIERNPNPNTEDR